MKECVYKGERPTIVASATASVATTLLVFHCEIGDLVVVFTGVG